VKDVITFTVMLNSYLVDISRVCSRSSDSPCYQTRKL